MSDIERIGVIGTGTMGAGIAQLCAQSGYEVVLRSRSRATAEAAREGIEKQLIRLVEKGRLPDEDKAAALDRLHTTDDLRDVAACDLVLESAIEDLETKKSLFQELDGVCGPEAVLASNTSTLSVTELASETTRPERVLGIHFFNPAPVMRLVEMVPTILTSGKTLDTARSFAESLDKDPVVVKDRAGFVVNALLFPYLNQAVRMLDMGLASRDDIDSAMRGGCGYPMGPLQLLDLIGLDTAVSILEALHREYGDHAMAPAPLLRRLVAADRLGRKTGEGFYRYTEPA